MFGCPCFIHSLTNGKDKLQHKIFKCVFLEYSHLQKDYRCFDFSTNTNFISGNGTFSKTSPYFSPNMENQKAIAVLPIPTIPTPAPPPTLNAYSRQLQPPSKLANLVDVSKSNRGAQSNLGDCSNNVFCFNRSLIR